MRQQQRNARISARRQTRSPSLRLEVLEARENPTTFVVTTLDDAGAGSLRDAIAQANDETTNPGADTIVFDPTLAGQTIGLTTFENPTTGTTVGPTALVITSDITIEGSGQTITRADPAAFRLFQVTSPASMSKVRRSGGGPMTNIESAWPIANT